MQTRLGAKTSQNICTGVETVPVLVVVKEQAVGRPSPPRRPMGDGGEGGGDPSVGAMSTAPSSVPMARGGGPVTRENGHCTDAKQEGQCAPMRCGWCTPWLTCRTVAKILSSTRDKEKIRTVQFSAPILGRPPNPNRYPNTCVGGAGAHPGGGWWRRPTRGGGGGGMPWSSRAGFLAETLLYVLQPWEVGPRGPEEAPAQDSLELKLERNTLWGHSQP